MEPRCNPWDVSLAAHTSLEMRRWWLFLIRTLTGLWTSSEEVPDAWSLSPSEPIFTFSWTIPTTQIRTDCYCQDWHFHPTQVFGLFLFCFIALFLFHFLLFLHLSVHIPIRGHDLLSFLDFIYPSKNAMVGSQSQDDGLYHPHCRGVSQVCIKYHW